jgi:anti-sigma factor RsiW
MHHNESTENMALLYAYGELGPDLRPGFESHLKECPQCRSIVDACALAAAATAEVAAPAFSLETAVDAAAPATRQHANLSDYIGSLFTLRHLLPSAAAALLLVFMGTAAYRYAGGARADGYPLDNMHAELGDIETALDDIYEDFESL